MNGTWSEWILCVVRFVSLSSTFQFVLFAVSTRLTLAFRSLSLAPGRGHKFSKNATSTSAAQSDNGWGRWCREISAHVTVYVR